MRISSITDISKVSPIFRDTFIYEYVGDVVNPNAFKKRMRDYAQEGIRHFYFMMLQKDEVSQFAFVVRHLRLSPSLSMQQRMEVLVASQTTVVIQTATLQSGPLEITSEWEFLPNGTYRDTRN